MKIFLLERYFNLNNKSLLKHIDIYVIRAYIFLNYYPWLLFLFLNLRHFPITTRGGMKIFLFEWHFNLNNKPLLKHIDISIIKAYIYLNYYPWWLFLFLNLRHFPITTGDGMKIFLFERHFKHIDISVIRACIFLNDYLFFFLSQWLVMSLLLWLPYGLAFWLYCIL